MSTEKRRKSPKQNKDGIEGRTNYMKYRNAQIYLMETMIFRFDDPDFLEAIILSYSYEGMQGLSLSEATDDSMKYWLKHYIEFIDESLSEDWIDYETFMKLNPFSIKGIEWILMHWDEKSRNEKVVLFEQVRHSVHHGGSYLEYIIDQSKLKDPDNFKAWMNSLEHLLD
jgi:hypothetical protein